MLGPVLFLIYVNDITGLPIGGEFTVFADDITLFWHNRSQTELNNSISNDLQSVKMWCNANSLVLNISKTDIVSFRCHVNQVKLEDNIVKNCEEPRFLGSYIDKKLKFQTHVANLNKKTRCKLLCC